MSLLRTPILYCCLALIATACSAPAAKSPAAGLASYGAEHAALLDDGFSGHLFETSFTPGTAGDDPHFENRVRVAECIWQLKVATVSLEGSLGNNRRYGLVFRTIDSLAGPLPSAPVSLTISAKDPAFHWLDRVGGAWVGHEVILMVRNYRNGDEVTIHFHGEPNSPEIQARIREIRAQVATSERAAPTLKK